MFILSISLLAFCPSWTDANFGRSHHKHKKCGEKQENRSTTTPLPITTQLRPPPQHCNATECLAQSAPKCACYYADTSRPPVYPTKSPTPGGNCSEFVAETVGVGGICLMYDKECHCLEISETVSKCECYVVPKPGPPGAHNPCIASQCAESSETYCLCYFTRAQGGSFSMGVPFPPSGNCMDLLSEIGTAGGSASCFDYGTDCFCNEQELCDCGYSPTPAPPPPGGNLQNFCECGFSGRGGSVQLKKLPSSGNCTELDTPAAACTLVAIQ